MAIESKSFSTVGVAHIAAALTVTMWGVSFVSSTVMMDHGLGPVTVYISRFIGAYLIMWILCNKRLWANSLRDELLLAVCGITGSTINYLAENYALKYTLATNVSLITSMAPLVTMLLVGLIYRNERPTRGALLGSLVAFLGVGFVIFNSSLVMKINPLGDLLSLAAAFSWACYTIVLRKVQAFYDVAFVTRKTFFYGLVTSLPFLLFSGEHLFDPAWHEPAVWVNYLFLTLGCSTAGFMLWAVAVKGIGAVKANNYMYFQPVVTLVFAVLFLGQAITVVGVIGFVLILTGVILSDKLDMRERMRR
ncbi:MAG: DMT family transporter [Candidatus Amulumruptor caecigallinarius]|nr:DMT family transporter [Candidatus Amulumruptor caecigallinarius]MCM1396623.1 DMT family transporter [Candidatus Amulumruptor caecigallinarius]MCM1453319.1 DMT family transporter [bacterium]